MASPSTHRGTMTARERLRAQWSVSRVLSSAETLSQAGPGILQAICEEMGWDAAALWVADPAAGVLRCDEVWRCSTGEPGHPIDAIRPGMVLSPGIGLPGSVWSRGRTSWSRQVFEEPALPRPGWALNLALRGALAFPLTLGSVVLGVVECFSEDAFDPDHELVGTLESIGHQLAQFIQRERVERDLAYITKYDKLTGLASRSGFEDILDGAIARAAEEGFATALLYVDLDEFNLVNDSLGRGAGDDLLRQVGGRLERARREGDVVGRASGDEFMILLSALAASEPASGAMDDALLLAETAAAKVHEALRQPFQLAGSELYATASIGLALFPQDGTDGATLIHHATDAMYRSKMRGPGGSMVFQATAPPRSGRLDLATRLRRAVELRSWVLHYQPVVHLVRGDVVGVEALLRWKDPARGLVSPGDFIPLAEEMGLIEPIGEWVLEELARQSRLWEADGLQLQISFNLSARQLWHPNLVDNLLAQLHNAGLSDKDVIIEITESAVMTEPDRTRRVLQDLRDQGVRFAIDDFGTGYSSLSRLMELPVDVLKIDRSFVQDLPGAPQAGAVVRAIIQMAETLGMTPLAEGIEREDQRAFLVSAGCHLGQGFLFSPPVPPEDMLDLTAHDRFALGKVIDLRDPEDASRLFPRAG